MYIQFETGELQTKVSFQSGFTPFELRYDDRYPNVFYIINAETGKIYFTPLTENQWYFV